MTNHPKPSGALRSLRARNRSLVIDVLRHEGSASRAEIARRTGLSRAAISSLVADLQREGLVIPTPRPSRCSTASVRRFGRYALPAEVQAVSAAAGAVGEHAALLGVLAS